MSIEQSRRGFLAGVVLWSVTGMLTVVSTLPDAVVTPPSSASTKGVIRALWPQAWGFFTRSPRESDYRIYRIGAGGGLTNASLGPYVRPVNLFGVSRRARAQGPELASLLRTVPATAWRDCSGGGYTIDECGHSAAVGVRLRNDSPLPSFCGQLYIAQDEPVPWAWLKLARHERKITRIAAVDVTCRS